MKENDKNLIKMLNESIKKSVCALCGSEAYGNGCIYSARGLHLHMDNPSKCGWCGSSTIVGKGCIISPTGFHGVGANLYTSMVSECFITSYLIKKLKTPFNETKAYEYGIISKDGNLIKKPISEEEKKSYTFLDSFVFKVKRYLGNKLDLLKESIYFEASKSCIQENSSVEDFENELKLKKKLNIVSRDFYDVISNAEKENIPTTVIEKSIIECFLNDQY
jgi:hypothetical protein